MFKVRGSLKKTSVYHRIRMCPIYIGPKSPQFKILEIWAHKVKSSRTDGKELLSYVMSQLSLALVIQKINTKFKTCPLIGRIQIWIDFLKNDHC